MSPSRTSNPLDALDELVRRQTARQDFIAYSQYVAPWYKPGKHHRLVGEKLMLVLRYIETGGQEGIGRLIISEPFRHGKSEQVSRLFPSYLLGKRPESRVILTSYGADLAEDDSRKVRNYVESDEFAALFGQGNNLATIDDEEGGSTAGPSPVQVNADSRKRANWSVAEPHRGGVAAAGIGGGIVGKGANLLVIDDPYKKRDEADSETYRRSVSRWYKGSAYTRLEPGGAIVVIHNRWNPEDLAGELLQEMVNGEGDQWEMLFLPALALEAEDYPKTQEEFRNNLLHGIYIPFEDPLGRKPGEALWPERFSRAAMLNIKTNIGEEEFVSQGQQLPMPPRGELFSQDDIQIAERAPEGLQWYCYVDLALGKTKLSNFNAACRVAIDDKGNLYGRDMLRVRKLGDFLDLLVQAMLSDMERGTIWGIEDVAFQNVVITNLMRDKRLARVAIGAIKPNGDKVYRARAVQLRATQGLFWLVRGNWNKACIQEMMVFPHAKDADQVDTISGGVEMIANGAGSGKTETSEAVVIEASMFSMQNAEIGIMS
jgi:predicted phage terminase large subunit-like protein